MGCNPITKNEVLTLLLYTPFYFFLKKSIVLLKKKKKKMIAGCGRVAAVGSPGEVDVAGIRKGRDHLGSRGLVCQGVSRGRCEVGSWEDWFAAGLVQGGDHWCTSPTREMAMVGSTD